MSRVADIGLLLLICALLALPVGLIGWLAFVDTTHYHCEGQTTLTCEWRK